MAIGSQTNHTYCMRLQYRFLGCLQKQLWKAQLKICFEPWLVWLSGLSASLQTKGSLV